jgi:RimJ/RimL family protein N-acetyltransferase
MTMIPDEPWFPVRTERLLLREFREADFEDVHEYGADPKVARFMDWGPNTPEETRAFLDRALGNQQTWPRPDVGLAVQHVADDCMIGSIRLWVTDEAHATGEIGYSLNAAFWRQGYCTEAARALLQIGFGVLGLHRITATCDPRNRGSWAVMQKLGMRREGRLRSSKLVKGAWRDTYVYAILASEFGAGA